jgi:hypothetical protein
MIQDLETKMIECLPIIGLVEGGNTAIIEERPERHLLAFFGCCEHQTSELNRFYQSNPYAYRRFRQLEQGDEEIREGATPDRRYVQRCSGSGQRLSPVHHDLARSNALRIGYRVARWV